MGLFGRRRTQSARTVTAAARRIDTDTADADVFLKRMANWQQRAWQYVDQIPEVPYAARYYANGLSRIVLRAAATFPGSAEPVPLSDEGDPDVGYSAQEAATVVEALDRLRGPQGGQSEILRRLGLQLFVPGEGLLFGREDPEYGGERWDVYSTEELTLDSGRKIWQLHDPPVEGSKGTGRVKAEFPKDDVVAIRVWRSHGRYFEWPDSPMRAAEMILDELLVLTKAIHAVATSRTAGPGIMFLPSSLRNRWGDETTTATDGQSLVDDAFVIDLIETTAKTIADPGLASAQVPNFVFVPDDIYEQVGSDKLVQWSRELDSIMNEQRESLLRRFATGVDVPAEVLLGMSDLNHWTSWQVPESAYRDHFAPIMKVIIDALTTRYLWPALRTAEVQDPERFAFLADPAALVSPPDQSKDYKWAYEQRLVSDEATRTALGIGEDEAPDEEEKQTRIVTGGRRDVAPREIERGAPPGNSPNGRGSIQAEAETLKDRVNAVTQLIRAGFLPEAALEALGLPPIPHSGLQPVTVKEPDEETAQRGMPPQAAIAASVGRRPLDLAGLPSALGRIDAALLSELVVAADAAMRRVLERANLRIRTLALRDAGLKRLIAGARADALEVAPILGPETVGRLAANTDLLADGFDRLRIDYDRRVGRAGEEAIRLAIAHGDLSDAEARIMLDRLDQEREASWGVLLAALTGLAAERLYTPHPAEEIGEIVDSLVPPGVIREALVRAGGGGGVSMLTGRLIEELFRNAGVTFSAWRWVYGNPASRVRPFEPHRILDGVEFDSWDDEVLGWPNWPYQRHPLDHAGCLCGAERAIAVRIESPERAVA